MDSKAQNGLKEEKYIGGNSNDVTDKDVKIHRKVVDTVRKCVHQQRYVLVLMAFIGFTLNSLLRSNINLALVAMVNHTAINKDQNETEISSQDDGPYVWDESVQSLILSSFYWGYLVTNIAGGRIAEKYGFKHLTSIGLIVSAILTLLTPLFAKIGWQMMVASRAIMGFVLGPSYPSITVMMAAWIPGDERNRISSIIHNGPFLGSLLASLVTGVVSETVGWEVNYYVMGGLSAVWVIGWELIIYDHPEDHPRISTEELDYIQQSQEENHKYRKSPKIPWRAMMLSPPVWAIIITNTTFDWLQYTYAMYMPDYMKYMMNMSIDEIGYYLSVGSALTLVVSFILAFVADFVISRNLVSRTVQRKQNTLWLEWGTAACFTILCFVDGYAAVIALILLSQFFSGGGSSGYLINPVDIAPNFSGTIFGIANTMSTALGMVTPVVTGRILENGQTQKSWRIVFLISAGMNFFGGLVYLIWGSGKEQKWNDIGSGKETTESKISGEPSDFVKETKISVISESP